MVAIAVLVLLVVAVARIMSSATTLTNTGSKRLDTDTQARLVLDRMAVDFSQMIKRSDVDLYCKGVLDSMQGGGTGPNDRIAFFSNVPGYYPPTGSQSPVSLVTYRVNNNPNSPSYRKLERMGKGLLWNAVSTSYKPLMFGASGTLAANWLYVTDNSSADPDSTYETIGPQIFRLEYFYLLSNPDPTTRSVITNNAPIPWYQGMAAICINIAAIDSKSRLLLSDAQLNALATTKLLDDAFVSTPPTGTSRVSDLPEAWQTALDGISNMPRQAISGIKVYQRVFYLWYN